MTTYSCIVFQWAGEAASSSEDTVVIRIITLQNRWEQWREGGKEGGRTEGGEEERHGKKEGGREIRYYT